MRKLSLIIVMFFINVSVISANIITVSQSGGGDYTTINAALAAAVSGDVIQIIDGSWYNETVTFTTPDSITLEGVGDNKPTISSATNNVININNYSITVRNLKLVVGSSGCSAIYIAADNAHIDNCEITAALGATSSYGIRLTSSANNAVIENCDIYNEYTSTMNYGIYLDTINSNNVNRIQYNKIHNINIRGIWAYPPAQYEADTYIVGNEIYDLSGGDGINISVKGGTQKILYNTVYNCSGAGIYVNNDNGLTYIYNNTLSKNTDGLYISMQGSGFSYEIYNNIAYHNYSEDFNFNNMYSTNTGSIRSEYNHHKVENTVGFSSNINYIYGNDIINEDPKFVDYQANNFELLPDSGCIDTGKSLETYYASEGYSFKYYGPIDRGAHEYFPPDESTVSSDDADNVVAVNVDKHKLTPGSKVGIVIDKLDNITSDDRVFLNVEIFDAKGRTVKSLIKSIVSTSGNFQFQWDGTDNNNEYVSSGLYLIVITAGKTQQYEKIFWIR